MKSTTKGNITDKARFFAQYWMQKILKGFPEDTPLNFRRVMASNIDRAITVSYLGLKPLSSISDEDAIQVANKIGYFFDKVIRGDKYIYVTYKHNCNEDLVDTLRIYHNGEVFFIGSMGVVHDLSMEQAEEVISFFRSKGIAYQFNGISVEEQIEFGWIKLKQ